MLRGNAWRIGSFGGIEIRIDPSWSFIAFLIGYSFFLILDDRFTDTGTGTVLVLAIAMAVLFFASVLLHELAHSWMARSRGVDVRGITLFLFGGATHADLETEDPNDEFVISAVGPLTSVAIAAVLWVFAIVFGDGTLLGFAAGRLGWINLALAVFNLAPGFPLDGGRILRSVVWRSTGDLVKATRIASRTGQGLGYLLIALGILQIFTIGALIGGLWLIAIGWFLSQSAQASFMQLQVKRLLADVPASQLMTGDLVHIPADITLQEAIDEYFMRHDHNAFPVADSGDVTGIITLGAIREVPRGAWDERTVRDTLTPLSDACTAAPSDPMDEVLAKLSEGETRRVIVVADGRIEGIVTPRNITRWLERSQQLGLTEQLSN